MYILRKGSFGNELFVNSRVREARIVNCQNEPLQLCLFVENTKFFLGFLGPFCEVLEMQNVRDLPL